MASESDTAHRRVPSLVSHCQRGEQLASIAPESLTALPHSPLSSCRRYVLSSLIVLGLNTPTAITCLGDDVRYDVIKPVLECCSADTLLRLEQFSPVSPSRINAQLPSHPCCSILDKTPQVRPCLAPNSASDFYAIRSLGTSLLQVLPSTSRTTHTECWRTA